MERLMGALLLLLVVVGGAPGAQCSRRVFPGHQYQGEGDTCLTPSGAPGTCSRSCGHSSGFEASGRCSPKDSTSLACCDTSLGASGIIFPGQLDHAEGDDCARHSGSTGTCVRACVNTADFGEPRKCGIKNSAFLVCCGKTLGVAPQPVTDIAPPPPTFQCGRNTQNFLESFFSFVDGKKIFVEPQDFNPAHRPLYTVVYSGLCPAIYINSTETLASGTKVDIQVGIAGVGAERADKNAWPWMALVGELQGEDITWFCGAVLINEHWVLSALHCFFHKVTRAGPWCLRTPVNASCWQASCLVATAAATRTTPACTPTCVTRPTSPGSRRSPSQPFEYSPRASGVKGWVRSGSLEQWRLVIKYNGGTASFTQQ